MPSIVSGEGVGFLDPHGLFFQIEKRVHDRTISENTSSYRWHLARDAGKISALQHQFDPFKQELFKFTEETLESGKYQGTIFRFPFRNGKMKSDIYLSKTLYDQAKIRTLEASLEADAQNVLLFLKNLESIEFFERTSGETRKLLDIRIEESYLDRAREGRKQFQTKVNCQFREWTTHDPVSAIYPILIEVKKQNELQSESSLWFISQFFAGTTEADNCKNLPTNLGYLPSAGVALPISLNNDERIMENEPRGHIFCFLPLPLEKKSSTGVKFHIHGCFALTRIDAISNGLRLIKNS